MSQFATLFAIMSQINIIRVKSLVLFSVKSQKTLCHNDFFDIICDGYGGYTGGTGGCPPCKSNNNYFFLKIQFKSGRISIRFIFYNVSKFKTFEVDKSQKYVSKNIETLLRIMSQKSL